jgi:hypothetical protein
MSPPNALISPAPVILDGTATNANLVKTSTPVRQVDGALALTVNKSDVRAAMIMAIVRNVTQ